MRLQDDFARIAECAAEMNDSKRVGSSQGPCIYRLPVHSITLLIRILLAGDLSVRNTRSNECKFQYESMVQAPISELTLTFLAV